MTNCIDIAADTQFIIATALNLCPIGKWWERIGEVFLVFLRLWNGKVGLINSIYHGLLDGEATSFALWFLVSTADEVF